MAGKKNPYSFLVFGLLMFAGATGFAADPFTSQLIVCEWGDKKHLIENIQHLNKNLTPQGELLRVVQFSGKKIIVGKRAGLCGSTISAPSVSSYTVDNLITAFLCVTVESTCTREHYDSPENQELLKRAIQEEKEQKLKAEQARLEKAEMGKKPKSKKKEEKDGYMLLGSRDTK